MIVILVGIIICLIFDNVLLKIKIRRTEESRFYNDLIMHGIIHDRDNIEPTHVRNYIHKVVFKYLTTGNKVFDAMFANEFAKNLSELFNKHNLKLKSKYYRKDRCH